MAEFRLGDNGAADTLFRSVLDICAGADQQADTAHVCGQAVNDLGLALLFEDRLPQAEQQFRQSLALARRVFGPIHPSDAVVLGNLGLVRERMGDTDGADKRYRESLAVWGKVKGEFPEQLMVLDNYASLLVTEGQPGLAEPLVTRAIAIGTRTEGPNHPNVGYSWVELGAIDWESGRLARADTETRHGLAILAAAGTSARYFFIKSWTDRGELLTAEGQPGEALPILRTVLDTATARYAAGDPQLAEVQLALGDALLASRERRAALPLLTASYGVLLRRYGAAHPETMRAKQRLADASH